MPTRDEEAMKLARMHYKIDDGVTQVFRVTAPTDVEAGPDEPIRLLEVNENTVASGIMPVWFGASRDLGLEHPSVILEATPGEFESILDRRWELPVGWQLADLILRPVAVNIL